MDEANFQAARRLCLPHEGHKLRRLTDFCTRHTADEVPDPSSGGPEGFERVLDLIEDACDGVLQTLRAAGA